MPLVDAQNAAQRVLEAYEDLPQGMVAADRHIILLDTFRLAICCALCGNASKSAGLDLNSINVSAQLSVMTRLNLSNIF